MLLNTPAEASAEPASAHDEALQLFEGQGAALFRFARVIVHEPADAEDVVQTTFVRLLDHLARGGSRVNLRAWLFTVAANLCRDRLRTRRRWLPWLPEHDRLLTTPAVVDARDPHATFLATIRALGPRDRMLLALKAQGLSYREIASVSGIRASSVGRLLARAMARWHRQRAAHSHS